MPVPQKSGRELGRELFAKVQGLQGHAFISDHIEDGYTPDQIFEVARQSMVSTARTWSVLHLWLKKHKQLPKKRRTRR